MSESTTWRAKTSNEGTGGHNTTVVLMEWSSIEASTWRRLARAAACPPPPVPFATGRRRFDAGPTQGPRVRPGNTMGRAQMRLWVPLAASTQHGAAARHMRV